MRKFILPVFLMLPVFCQASDRDDFESYKRQMQGGMQQQKEEYRAYTEKMKQDWNGYLDDIRKNFGSLELTSDKKWVNYSKDRKSKVALDNDKGVITIEFVANDKTKANGIREVKALVKELSKEVNPFSKAPTLIENVPLDNIRPELATPRGRGGKPGEMIYSLTIPMNEDRQENNVVQIAESVRDMTEKYGVPYDLVMAIIRSETNFNVGAGTRAGALDIRNPEIYENNPWGLMQVVPKRSGREGLRRAKGKDRVPTADELLDPQTNLEIGVAYLAVLQDNYFKGVKDENSRELLMISAYREGPEKVYSRFSTGGGLSEVVAGINRMGAEEVAARLAGKAASPGDGRYVSNVEKDRNNYRVGEQERQQFEQMAESIVKRPELRAAVNQWLGTPYRLGGTTRSAVDCSGFTMNIYAQVYNKKIPRSAQSQYDEYGRSTVSEPSRREGDLVYFNTLHNGNPVSHVGIWLDDRRFVHASSSKGVIIADITNAYYRARYVGANRPLRE